MSAQCDSLDSTRRRSWQVAANQIPQQEEVDEAATDTPTKCRAVDRDDLEANQLVAEGYAQLETVAPAKWLRP
jgi:hypothetical protein